MIATKYKIDSGVGRNQSRLVSFDDALLKSGVGNYNLVRLSSILPAHCKKVDTVDLTEGSLLPIAYASISSNVEGERIVSVIGIGFPEDEDKVGVIMEYSAKNISFEDAMDTLVQMIKDAFDKRHWKLKNILKTGVYAVVGKNESCSTFACVAEWE